jgi:electron transfer flavoprotein-quinone oxidoreductase
LALNLGVTVRGMDYALASGAIAAEIADQALEKTDFSREFLSMYERKLKESFVLRDMETFRHSRHVLENPRLFTVYPRFLCEALETMFSVGEGPKPPLYEGVKKTAREYVLNYEGFKDFLRMRKI